MCVFSSFSIWSDYVIDSICSPHFCLVRLCNQFLQFVCWVLPFLTILSSIYCASRWCLSYFDWFNIQPQHEHYLSWMVFTANRINTHANIFLCCEEFYISILLKQTFVWTYGSISNLFLKCNKKTYIVMRSYPNLKYWKIDNLPSPWKRLEQRCSTSSNIKMVTLIIKLNLTHAHGVLLATFIFLCRVNIYGGVKGLT